MNKIIQFQNQFFFFKVFITGGGIIVGPVSNSGQLTGGDISFLFPDLRTGITGQKILNVNTLNCSEQIIRLIECLLYYLSLLGFV